MNDGVDPITLARERVTRQREASTVLAIVIRIPIDLAAATPDAGNRFRKIFGIARIAFAAQRRQCARRPRRNTAREFAE
ncbi:MAG TPA: hypothetical protein VH082_11340, partial [Rudaea sp.]|nr:hypothetical protein [Rudaea sp.]